MEEIVALFSIGLLTAVGWVVAKLCFSRIINDENCIYFAPALGAGICGVIAYVAVHSYQPWIISAFCGAVILVALVLRKRLGGGSAAPRAMGENDAATSHSSSGGAL